MATNSEIESIFQQHKAPLCSFCFRLLGDRELAEDIVQDVFLQVIKDDKTDVAWLYTCARNRCLDRLRRRGLWAKIKDNLKRATTWLPGFEEQLVETDLGQRVLSQLSPKHRSLLLMRSYLGLNYKELAQIFETTPKAVGVMLSRARTTARKVMKKEVGAG